MDININMEQNVGNSLENKTMSEKTLEFRNTVKDIKNDNSCRYVRQDSMSDGFENHIKPNTNDVNFLSRQSNGYDKTCVLEIKENKFKRQISSQLSNLSTEAEELLMKETNTPENKCVIILTNHQTKAFEKSINEDVNESSALADSEKDYVDNEKEKLHPENARRCQKCTVVISTGSCVLSILAMFFVLFVLLKISVSSETPALSPIALAQESSKSTLVASGSFKLDQHYLKNFQQIRWLPDENSLIEPSGDGGCLRMPTSGKYLIVSRFTFIIPAESRTVGIMHFFKVLDTSGAIKDGGYHRKYVNVAEIISNDFGDDVTKLKTPSVFVAFIEIESEETICANVSTPELLYVSSLDNDINIVQV